jgi:predicted small lipoprotein YifL
MKTGILLLVLALGLTVAACGVKSDLARPDGTTTPKDTPDPSKPPYPIGR